MKQLFPKLIGFLFVSLLTAPTVLSTTVQKLELPQLVSLSDNIVQGRVESVEARMEGSKTYTYVSLIVDDPLKGDRHRSVLLRHLGGKIGARRTWVAGMPQFHVGDQVIVFLRDRHDGTFDVSGLNQGKYDIVNDFAVANVSGVTVLDPKTGRMSDGGFVEKVPIEAFKARIRELIQ